MGRADCYVGPDPLLLVVFWAVHALRCVTHGGLPSGSRPRVRTFADARRVLRREASGPGWPRPHFELWVPLS